LYTKALELIKNSRYILIATHINPDADTLSCALALSNYFKENKIKHSIFNKMKSLPRSIDFLSNFHKISDQIPKFYDLIISVDCANLQRIGLDLDNNTNIINIDHHQSNDNFGIINIVDDTKASTAEVIYDFFDKNNLKISKNIAQCIYVGLYDDSVAFTTPRCDHSSFEKANHLVKIGVDPSYIANMLLRRDSLAKYRVMPLVLNSLELHFEGKVATIHLKKEWLDQSGASYQECEELTNMILRIGIVDIALFFRYSNGVTRVSMRSKNNIDLTAIASHFNGGGHKMAAGCTCKTTDIKEAKDMLLEYIKETNIYGI
jgi:phosphoesterase RecJ-like protein